MEEVKLGEVTHFFTKIEVGIIKVTDGELNVGDTLHFKGHTSDFEQKVESMQIEHDVVESAKVGDLVGIKVKEHVREGDTVYKVTE